MLLRSEMKEEVRERNRNHEEKGQDRNGTTGKLEFLREKRRELSTNRDYEERVTYRTITRTEFQKRRASFESQDEDPGDGRKEKVENDRVKGLRKKTRSMDELIRKEKDDPYHIKYQEKEMTEKLEDIHRMIVDMQELTRQLKDKNYFPFEKNSGKISIKSIGISSSEVLSPPNENNLTKKPLLKSGPELIMKPIRYRSTILIPIGSKWQRFKEEIELNIDSRHFR